MIQILLVHTISLDMTMDLVGPIPFEGSSNGLHLPGDGIRTTKDMSKSELQASNAELLVGNAELLRELHQIKEICSTTNELLRRDHEMVQHISDAVNHVQGDVVAASQEVKVVHAKVRRPKMRNSAMRSAFTGAATATVLSFASGGAFVPFALAGAAVGVISNWFL